MLVSSVNSQQNNLSDTSKKSFIWSMNNNRPRIYCYYNKYATIGKQRKSILKGSNLQMDIKTNILRRLYKKVLDLMTPKINKIKQENILPPCRCINVLTNCRKNIVCFVELWRAGIRKRVVFHVI